jgi:hypothetical protein
MKKSRIKWIVVAGIILVGIGVGPGIARMTGDDDKPLTGETRRKAVKAALEETGGGEVTDTEAGDDNAAYSVEIVRGGRQVEVNLNRDFEVIGKEADDDTKDEDPDGDGADDDDERDAAEDEGGEDE